MTVAEIVICECGAPLLPCSSVCGECGAKLTPRPARVPAKHGVYCQCVDCTTYADERRAL